MPVRLTTSYLEDALAIFRYYKKLGEDAIAQVTDAELNALIDSEANSIALIVKHMAGNMKSRWTDFLTTDGEKPDRNRDSEFVAPASTREELMAQWERGWDHVWRALGPFWPQVLKRSENIDAARSPTQTKDGIFGINLYRANFLPRLFQPRERYTGKPVQLIVLQADAYVKPQLFEDMTLWAHNTWRRDVDAGHWTLLHEGERLAQWISDFAAQVETGKRAEGLRKLV